MSAGGVGEVPFYECFIAKELIQFPFFPHKTPKVE